MGILKVLVLSLFLLSIIGKALKSENKDSNLLKKVREKRKKERYSKIVTAVPSKLGFGPQSHRSLHSFHGYHSPSGRLGGQGPRDPRPRAGSGRAPISHWGCGHTPAGAHKARGFQPQLL